MTQRTWAVVICLLLAACKASSESNVHKDSDQVSSESSIQEGPDRAGGTRVKQDQPSGAPADRHVDEGPRGEIVEPADAAEAIEEAGAQFESPPGGALRTELVPPTQMDVETAEFTAAFRLACQWFRYWLDGIAIGDDAAMELATPVLLEVPTWPPMADMEGFWEMFVDIVELEAGASDGPQWFVDANCPDVRDELPAPMSPPIQNAAASVVLGPDDSSRVEPDERADAIARLGAGIPLPSDHSFDMLIDATHTESENALTGVLVHHAWCRWLGVLIDGIEQRDDSAVVEALGNLQWFVEEWDELPIAGPAIRRQVAEVIIESADGREYWAISDYLLNCFGIDPARDERLNSQ